MPNLPDSTSAVSPGAGSVLDQMEGARNLRAQQGMQNLLSQQGMQMDYNLRNQQQQLQQQELAQQNRQFNQKLQSEKDEQVWRSGEAANQRQHEEQLQRMHEQNQDRRTKEALDLNLSMKKLEIDALTGDANARAAARAQLNQAKARAAQLQAEIGAHEQARNMTVGELQNFAGELDKTRRDLTEQHQENTNTGTQVAKSAYDTIKNERVSRSARLHATTVGDAGTDRNNSWYTMQFGSAPVEGADLLTFKNFSDEMPSEQTGATGQEVGEVDHNSIAMQARGAMMDAVSTEISKRMNGKIAPASVQEALSALYSAPADKPLTPADFMQKLSSAGVPPQVVRQAMANIAEMASHEAMAAKEKHLAVQADYNKNYAGGFHEWAGTGLLEGLNVATGGSFNPAIHAANAVKAAEATMSFYKSMANAAGSGATNIDDMETTLKGMAHMQDNIGRLVSGREGWDPSLVNIKGLSGLSGEQQRHLMDRLVTALDKGELVGNRDFLRNYDVEHKTLTGRLPQSQQEINDIMDQYAASEDAGLAGMSTGLQGLIDANRKKIP